MKRCARFYIGDGVKDHKKTIMKMIKKKKAPLGVYLLCKRDGDESLLTVMAAREFFKDVNKNYRIVGIANNEEDARLLVRDIIADFCSNNTDFSEFYDYLLEGVSID